MTKKIYHIPVKIQGYIQIEAPNESYAEKCLEALDWQDYFDYISINYCGSIGKPNEVNEESDYACTVRAKDWIDIEEEK